MPEFTDVSKDKLVADMKVVIADAEELLKATASAAGDRVTAARTRMEDSLRTARIKLAEAQEVVVDKAKAAARATDDYVHANPWRSVGIAAGAGLVIGMLISRR
ncbi:MAG TPA: DUF883 family protein [Burkholderiales bacterium]|jgi:ElaB/YqjD/DUF883 family membrane-anchored ribosome-binding protein|nr:DUF883 family protein [Burkholderiales bacterium]